MSAAPPQGVALSDFCRAIVLTKEHLWEFLQRQDFMNSPVELYGEMELLRLLDQFFDRGFVLCDRGLRAVQPVAKRL